jgi:hypothetical protein
LIVSRTIGAPGRSLSNGSVEQPHQVPRLEVLNNLRGEQSPKRTVRKPSQVRKRIPGFRL